MKISIPFPDRLNKISKHRQFLYGFAALWIMFYHMGTKVPGHGIWRPLFYFQATGAAGVELFLLLTGFGLYASMKKDARAGIFYKKRFARVFLPSFIALSIMGFFLPQRLTEYLGSITLLGQWFGINTPWYVAFILTMYLVYPLIFAITDKKRWVLYILACFFLGLSLVLSPVIGDTRSDLLRMISRIPIFLVGCALAPHFENNKPLPKRVFLISFILTIPLMWLHKKTMGGVYLYTIRAIAYFFYAIDLIIIVSMIAELLSRKAFGNIIYRCFAFCGQISLEIYLLFTRIRVLCATLPGFNAHPCGNLKLDIATAICTLILSVVLQNIAQSVTKVFSGIKIPEAEKHPDKPTGKNSKIR